MWGRESAEHRGAAQDRETTDEGGRACIGARSPGYVVLNDGTVFSGFGFAAPGKVFGEIVFNTGMTGYQEVATDPSYYGQMVTFTYPMIGNYGAADRLLESDRVHSRAIVVREAKNTGFNRTCPEPWLAWLEERRRGRGRWSRHPGADAAHPGARRHDRLCCRRGRPARQRPARRDPRLPVPLRARPRARGDLPRSRTRSSRRTPGPHVVAFDYGIKRSILRHLTRVGCRVTVVPAHVDAQAGAGSASPTACSSRTARAIRLPSSTRWSASAGLLGKVPIFGICLGHQLISLGRGSLDLQTQVRPPGHQPPGQELRAGGHRDHQPEPRVRGDAAARGRPRPGTRAATSPSLDARRAGASTPSSVRPR